MKFLKICVPAVAGSEEEVYLNLEQVVAVQRTVVDVGHHAISKYVPQAIVYLAHAIANRPLVLKPEGREALRLFAALDRLAGAEYPRLPEEYGGPPADLLAG